MMGLLTESNKNYKLLLNESAKSFKFNLKFKGGYYSNSIDSFGELNKNIDKIVAEVKNSKNQKLLRVVIRSGESAVPNTDNELNGKRVEPGYLSQKRFETIKSFVTNKFKQLQKIYPKLQSVTFDPDTSPKVGKDIILKKSGTSFIGQKFCPKDKIDIKTDPQGYTCTDKNFVPGENIKNWTQGKETDYADIKQKYIDDQFVEVELFLDTVLTEEQKTEQSAFLNAASQIATNRESISTLTDELNLFFYQYTIAGAIADSYLNGTQKPEFKNLPGQLLTMNKYFALGSDATNIPPLNCGPFVVRIIPEGGKQISIPIPPDKGNLTAKTYQKWTVVIAPKYRLEFDPAIDKNTDPAGWKGQWLFAAYYLNGTKNTTNDWQFISNKPKDIDFTIIETITPKVNTKKVQGDPVTQENWFKTWGDASGRYRGYYNLLNTIKPTSKSLDKETTDKASTVKGVVQKQSNATTQSTTKKTLKEEISRIQSMMGVINESITEDVDIVIEYDDDALYVNILTNGENVGNITLEGYGNVFTIVDAEIKETKRGMGLYSKSLIKLLNEMPNIEIVSVFRSPEADNSWSKLIGSYLPQDITYNKKFHKEENTTEYRLFKYMNPH